MKKRIRKRLREILSTVSIDDLVDVMYTGQCVDLFESMFDKNRWETGDYDFIEGAFPDTISTLVGITKMKHPGEFWVTVTLSTEEGDDFHGTNMHYFIEEDTTPEDLKDLFTQLLGYALIEIGKEVQIWVDVA